MAARISSAIRYRDKGRRDRSQGRKAKGPRFLREARDDPRRTQDGQAPGAQARNDQTVIEAWRMGAGRDEIK